MILAVGRRVRMRHVLRALRSEGPRSVLDAGCSDAWLSARIAREHPQAHVLGIDPDASALERRHRAPNLVVRKAAIGADLRDTFDLVVCTDVLEHVEEDEDAVRWLADHVAARGRLVLHVPASPQRHALARVRDAMAAELAGGRGPHLREGYERDALERLLQACGLVDVDVRYTFHVAAVRLATDFDTWTFITGRRWAKALVLPLLLTAASLERAPSAGRRGNGLLAMARKP